MLMLIDKMRKRFLEIGCYLFSATIALPIKFNNFAIAIIVIAWIFEFAWGRKWELIRERKLLFSLPIVYVVYLIGMAYTENIDAGLRHLEVKSTFLIFPLAIGSSVTLDREAIRRILNVFVGSILIICLYCLAWAYHNFLQDGEVIHFWYYDLVKPIGVHPIYLANYIALSIIILLYRLNWNHNSLVISFFQVLKVIGLFYVVILLSALSVLGFLFSYGMFLGCRKVLKFSTTPKAILVILSIGILGILVVMNNSMTAHKISKMTNLNYQMDDPDYAWNSLTIRLAKWNCSIDVIKDNVFVGVGTGDEQDELMLSYERNNFKEGIRCEYNSHNQYLSTFIALGFIGLISLIATLIIPLVVGVKSDNILLTGFILLMMIGFTTENMLSVQKGTVFFSFFYTILLVMHNGYSPHKVFWTDVGRAA